MVEKHYGHLAPSFIVDAIHAGAPRFAGANTPSSVVPMPAGKPKRAIMSASEKTAPRR